MLSVMEAVSAVHVSGGRGGLYLTFIVAIVCCGVEVRMPSDVLQKEDCSLHGIVEAGSMFAYTNVTGNVTPS